MSFRVQKEVKLLGKIISYLGSAHFHTIHNDMSWRQRCCCRFWGSCCEASWRRRPAVSSSSHPKASGLEVLSNTTWWENWLICEAAAPWEINISMHLSHYSNHHVLTIHLAYCWIIITLGPFYLTKNLPPKLSFFRRATRIITLLWSKQLT